jgi:hypothetical protein
MMRLNLPHEIRIQRRLAAAAANLAKALEYESAPVGIRPAAALIPALKAALAEWEASR